MIDEYEVFESIYDAHGRLKPYEMGRREKYMSPRMRNYFNLKLNRMKEKILMDAQETVRNLHQSNDEHLADSVDRASQEELRMLELRTRAREHQFLKNIDAMLELLENQEYGYCQNCGDEIGLQRLEIRPTAKLCIDCKQLEEISERQTGKVYVGHMSDDEQA